MQNYYLAACGHYVPVTMTVIKCPTCLTGKTRQKCEQHIICNCSQELTMQELINANNKLNKALRIATDCIKSYYYSYGADHDCWASRALKELDALELNK